MESSSRDAMGDDFSKGGQEYHTRKVLDNSPGGGRERWSLTTAAAALAISFSDGKGRSNPSGVNFCCLKLLRLITLENTGAVLYKDFVFVRLQSYMLVKNQNQK